MEQRDTLAIDSESLARTLALNAGIDWDALRDYPGYGKNVWREKARHFFAAMRTTV